MERGEGGCSAQTPQNTTLQPFKPCAQVGRENFERMERGEGGGGGGFGGGNPFAGFGFGGPGGGEGVRWEFGGGGAGQQVDMEDIMEQFFGGGGAGGRGRAVSRRAGFWALWKITKALVHTALRPLRRGVSNCREITAGLVQFHIRQSTASGLAGLQQLPCLLLTDETDETEHTLATIGKPMHNLDVMQAHWSMLEVGWGSSNLT